MFNIKRNVIIMATLLTISLYAGAKLNAPVFNSTLSMQFLGENQIATGTLFEQVPIGGLSGIHYDSQQKLYYAISDARNTKQEGIARFYTFQLDISLMGINNITTVGVKNLVGENGQPWSTGTVDAEGIAPTPDGKNLYWSSELGSPLRISDMQGRLVADLKDAIPTYYNAEAEGRKEDAIGVRSGVSFEGLSLTKDKKYLYVGVEAPLKQDGPLASPTHSGVIRILKYQINPSDNSLKLDSEFIYNLDAVPQVSEFGVNDNGLSELLAIDEHRVIIIERAGRNASKGFKDFDFNVRAYLVDLRQSTNIKDTISLVDINHPQMLQPAQKKLLIDFNLLTDKPDCIEGVTFGPDIDGKKTLVFVSDNNFQPYQTTKFYLFLDNRNLLK